MAFVQPHTRSQPPKNMPPILAHPLPENTRRKYGTTGRHERSDRRRGRGANAPAARPIEDFHRKWQHELGDPLIDSLFDETEDTIEHGRHRPEERLPHRTLGRLSALGPDRRRRPAHSQRRCELEQ
jgi:hypothetical protein